MQYLVAVDHVSKFMSRGIGSPPRMTGARAERFVVGNLRLLAASFAVVGILFIAVPNGVLDVISDLGDAIGDFTRAPETVEKFWLALGFAYMVVIAGICAVVQSDVVRYRPFLLVLAAGKAASSLSPVPPGGAPPVPSPSPPPARPPRRCRPSVSSSSTATSSSPS